MAETQHAAIQNAPVPSNASSIPEQNTDSKGLGVISHSVMILFRNNMSSERSLGFTSKKKKKKNHCSAAAFLLYARLALIL